jgi:methionine-rich copper-binding protein CopC
MRVAAAIGAVLALGLPAVALAHAELVTSDPADGATITLPYTLTATFNEEIDPVASTLFVENAAGEQVATGTVDPDDHTRMSADLMNLPAGDYEVRWTVVTPNDQAVERGTFSFSVSVVRASPPPGSVSGDTVPKGYEVAIALALAAILIGAVVFLILRRRR